MYIKYATVLNHTFFTDTSLNPIPYPDDIIEFEFKVHPGNKIYGVVRVDETPVTLDIKLVKIFKTIDEAENHIDTIEYDMFEYDIYEFQF